MKRPNTTRIFQTIRPKVAANGPRLLGCCLNQSNLSINKRTEPTLATKRPRALFSVAVTATRQHRTQSPFPPMTPRKHHNIITAENKQEASFVAPAPKHHLPH
ncbi:unnamed protein product, partial [Ixodes pacificus]